MMPRWLSTLDAISQELVSDGLVHRYVTADGLEGGEGSFFCRYGLAMQQLATRRAGCRDDPFGDGRQRIGHAGEAYSLRSGIWLDERRGTGTAYFITGNPEVGAPAGAISAFSAAEEAMAAASINRSR